MTEQHVWDWPDWMPGHERGLIERFHDWHGGPKSWMECERDQVVRDGRPPFGNRAVIITDDFEVVTGRWVPRWNNIGVVVTDDGRSVHPYCVFTSTDRMDRRIVQAEAAVSDATDVLNKALSRRDKMVSACKEAKSELEKTWQQ